MPIRERQSYLGIQQLSRGRRVDIETNSVLSQVTFRPSPFSVVVRVYIGYGSVMSHISQTLEARLYRQNAKCSDDDTFVYRALSQRITLNGNQAEL